MKKKDLDATIKFGQNRTEKGRKRNGKPTHKHTHTQLNTAA